MRVSIFLLRKVRSESQDFCQSFPLIQKSRMGLTDTVPCPISFEIHKDTAFKDCKVERWYVWRKGRIRRE